MALEHNAGLVQTLLSQRSWAPRRVPRGLRCSPLSIGISPGITTAPKLPSSSSPVLTSLWWLSVLPGVKSGLPLGPASSREVPEVGYGMSPRVPGIHRPARAHLLAQVFGTTLAGGVPAAPREVWQ